MTLPERAREAISTAHLGSDPVKTEKPAKLIDPAEVTVEFDHVPGNAPLLKQEPEPITITYPLQDGQLTADELQFTGYARASPRTAACEHPSPWPPGGREPRDWQFAFRMRRRGRNPRICQYFGITGRVTSTGKC